VNFRFVAPSDLSPPSHTLLLTAHVDAASSQATYDTDRVYLIRMNGNKMMVKSPGVIVPMTGQTSVVEFDLVKSD
jgi:hypothetical protein